MCPQFSAWSLTLLSLDLNQLYVWRSWSSWSYHSGQWQLWTWLFLFSFSLTSLILLAMGRAGPALPPCLSVQIQSSGVCWLSWYLYCCAGYKCEWWYNDNACYYKGWVQTCCGLTMAKACGKLQPCYWSQTWTFMRNDEIQQLILPISLCDKVLHSLHNDNGHQGQHCMLDLLCSKVYWPTMFTDTDCWLSQCKQCLVAKGNYIEPRTTG